MLEQSEYFFLEIWFQDLLTFVASISNARIYFRVQSHSGQTHDGATSAQWRGYSDTWEWEYAW